MQFNLAEILKDENNEKIFSCVGRPIRVKNVNEYLFFEARAEYVEDKSSGISGIIKFIRTGKRVKWEEAPASSFWVNAKYEELKE